MYRCAWRRPLRILIALDRIVLCNARAERNQTHKDVPLISEVDERARVSALTQGEVETPMKGAGATSAGAVRDAARRTLFHVSRTPSLHECHEILNEPNPKTVHPSLTLGHI